jgi:hypothetical protein
MVAQKEKKCGLIEIQTAYNIHNNGPKVVRVGKPIRRWWIGKLR